MRVFSLLLICYLLIGIVYASGQIDISYAGYTISQPGSYIVVADLYAATNQNTITVATSDVTIDLNGHVLYGAGTATGSTGFGVYAGSVYDNIAVYNGTVRDFRSSGIYILGINHQVHRIRVYANRYYGIYVGTNGIIWNNTVRENLSNGIITGDGCVIRHNSVRENNGDGILAGWDCTIIGNSIYNNGNHGIYGTSACNVLDNTVGSNVGNGIFVSTDCQVVRNNCDNNGLGSATASGIRVNGGDNNIENNHLTDNDMGLYISSAGNFYAGNRASGNTISDYSTVAGNTDGGTINTALSNVSFYHQPNLMVNHLAGFDIPTLRESTDAVVRNLRW